MVSVVILAWFLSAVGAVEIQMGTELVQSVGLPKAVTPKGLSISNGSWLALTHEIMGQIETITADAQGNVYIGGSFSEIKGMTMSNVARWDGSRWHAMGTGMNGTVRVLRVDNTGQLYAGGDFTTADGIPAQRIAKWDGTSWQALGSGLNAAARAIAFKDDGTCLVGGDFTFAGDRNANFIAAWNGTAWSSLGTGMNDRVETVLYNPITRTTYAGGLFYVAGAVVANRVASWDGSQWSAMGSGFNSTAMSLGMDPEGAVCASGHFTYSGTQSVRYAARWNGSAWTQLGTSMSRYQGRFFNRPNGQLFLGGWLWSGTDWIPAVPTGPVINEVAFDSTGALFTFGTIDGVYTKRGMFRLDGSAWSHLGHSGPDGAITSIAVNPVNGNVVVLGDFMWFNEQPASGRVTWDGNVWKPGIGGPYKSLQIAPNGQMYAFKDNQVYTSNGGEWTKLGARMNSTINDLQLDRNSVLYAGGFFTSSGGVPCQYLARWNGTAWGPVSVQYPGLLVGAMDLSDHPQGGIVVTASSLFLVDCPPDVSIPPPEVSKVVYTDIASDGSMLAACHTNIIDETTYQLWNGTTWNVLSRSSGYSCRPVILTDQGLMYRYGNNSIQTWNGSAWVSIANFDPNQSVTSYAIGHDGRLFAGLSAPWFSASSPNKFVLSPFLQVLEKPPFPVTITGPTLTNSSPFVCVLAAAVTFSGPVASDFTVTNGTITAISGSGNTREIAVTPLQDGPVTVQLNKETLLSAAGSATNYQFTFTSESDRTSPALNLSTPSTGSTTTENSFLVTIKSTESISGLAAGDLLLENCEPGPLQYFSGAWTVALTPLQDGLCRISIPANAATDAAGNASQPSNTLEIIADLPPKPQMVLPSKPTNLTRHELRLTWSEPITGLEPSDLTIDHGTLVALNGAGQEFTVIIDAAETDGTLAITIPSGTAVDMTGHPSNSGSWSMRIDRTPPVVDTSKFPVSGSEYQIDSVITVPIAWSEDVGSTFTTADIICSTPGMAVVSMTGSGRSFMLSLQMMAVSSEASLTIVGSDISDSASNRPIDTGFSVRITPDITPPSLDTSSFPVPGSEYQIGSSITVPIVWSEDVGTSFTTTDIFCSTPGMEVVSMTGSGRSFMLTLKMAAVSPEATLIIVGGGISDAYNNRPPDVGFKVRIIPAKEGTSSITQDSSKANGGSCGIGVGIAGMVMFASMIRRGRPKDRPLRQDRL